MSLLKSLNLFSRAVTGVSLPKYTSFRTLTIQREPVDLAHSIYKPENGSSNHPPLVILHGLFGCKNNWSSLAKRFAKDLNRQVIAVDARNHGDSPHHDKMDYHSMAADVSQLLNKLKISSAHILGHSMGGRTAMVLALTQPEVFFSFISEDVIPGPSLKADSFPLIIQAMKRIPLKQPGVNYADAQTIAMECLETVVKNNEQRAFLVENLIPNEGSSLRWRCNLDGIENDIQALCSWPATEVEGLQFNGPAFFIGAGQSGYSSDTDFIQKDVILKYFPLATTKVIPNAGHKVHVDEPDEFSRLVKDHIPELIFSIIVEDIIPGPSGKIDSFRIMLKALKRIQLKQPGASYVYAERVAQQQLKTIVANPARLNVLQQNLVQDKEDSLKWRCNLDIIEQKIEALYSFPAQEVEGLQFDGSILFIGGGKSIYSSDTDFLQKDLLLKYFPNVTTKVIPTAGHYVHIDEPDKLTDILKHWIETLERRNR